MLRVCLTGATGFIGENLLKHLSNRKDLEIIALSRRLSPELHNAKKGNVIWRRCDGFSMVDTEEALKESDVLIYLIHSMLPSTSLTQGSFSDFDLYLADNFARSAAKNNLKKIVYLGGLVPDQPNLSEHLKSRLEVERALGQYGTSTIVLRASLIVGKNGSSFKILEKLVRRLPISICPAWTLSKTQPIHLNDVLASLEHAIDQYSELSGVYDIGGPDVLTYKEMLQHTARVLDKKRFIINVPLFSPALSKLWVSKVTGTPSKLVYPLVESLKHEMVVRPEKQLKIPNHVYMGFTSSLEKGLSKKENHWVRDIIDYNANINLSWMRNVTSMQRVFLSKYPSAPEIASKYFEWLPRFLRPLIRVNREEGRVTFYFLFERDRMCLLQLDKSEDRSDEFRSVFYITGGLLAHPKTLNGRLEFRNISDPSCLIIGLLNFRPSIPWFIYKYTQAIIHLIVMQNFARHLRNSQ